MLPKLGRGSPTNAGVPGRMYLAEWFYSFALATYMVGLAFAFRLPAARWPLGIMAAGTLADFLITMLPRLGVEALAMHAEGRNTALILGSILGFATWTMFVGVVVAHRRGRLNLYLGLALATELVWFTCYLSFLYGLHAIPQT